MKITEEVAWARKLNLGQEVTYRKAEQKQAIEWFSSLSNKTRFRHLKKVNGMIKYAQVGSLTETQLRYFVLNNFYELWIYKFVTFEPSDRAFQIFALNRAFREYQKTRGWLYYGKPTICRSEFFKRYSENFRGYINPKIKLLQL